MVARFSLKVSVQLCAAIAAGSAVLPAPAFANNDSADIAAPLRAAAASSAARPQRDADFHQLFASWRALDNPQRNFAMAVPVLPATGAAGFSTRTAMPVAMPGSVSIPSRMPVDSFKLTSGFGLRWHPIYGGRHMHKGIDLADPTGTPVYATADGVIGRADWFSGYGLYIQIEHGGDLETRYGHLSRLNVAAGQTVHKGDLIGFVGATGHATGPHLHYEVRVAGVAVNPIPYMYGQATAASIHQAVAVPVSAYTAPVGTMTTGATTTVTATRTAVEPEGDE